MAEAKFSKNEKVMYANKVYTVEGIQYSQVRQEYIYKLLDNQHVSEIAFEGEIQPIMAQNDWKATITLDNNLAVLRVFRDGQEVITKHGHIFHDGIQGIVQAINYTSKQAFFEYCKVDEGERKGWK
jgi:hypothetical protein